MLLRPSCLGLLRKLRTRVGCWVMPPLCNLNTYASNQQWTKPVLNAMPTRYVYAEFMNMLMVICDILMFMFTCTFIQYYMQIVCIFVLLLYLHAVMSFTEMCVSCGILHFRAGWVGIAHSRFCDEILDPAQLILRFPPWMKGGKYLQSCWLSMNAEIMRSKQL